MDHGSKLVVAGRPPHTSVAVDFASAPRAFRWRWRGVFGGWGLAMGVVLAPVLVGLAMCNMVVAQKCGALKGIPGGDMSFCTVQ